MGIKDSQVVSRLPEFLIDRKEGDYTDKEILEALNPNTINVSASILEKILYGLDSFNNWDDFQKYSKEFKLDVVLGEINDVFKIDQPELLKGFFKSKGTLADIQFVLRTAGYNLNIYEADYYYRNQTISGVMYYHYLDIYRDLLDKYTEEDFQNALKIRYIHKVNNNQIIKVDNNSPLKVINVNIGWEEFFSSLGYTPTQDMIDKLPEVLQMYLDASLIEEGSLECSITADITADLENGNFDGMDVSKINKLLDSIVRNRLSVCTYLRRFMIFLEMEDSFVTKSRVKDNFQLEIFKSVLSDFDVINRLSDNELLNEFSISFFDRYEIVNIDDHEHAFTITKEFLTEYLVNRIADPFLIQSERSFVDRWTRPVYYVNNVNPYKVNGLVIKVPGEFRGPLPVDDIFEKYIDRNFDDSIYNISKINDSSLELSSSYTIVDTVVFGEYVQDPYSLAVEISKSFESVFPTTDKFSDSLGIDVSVDSSDTFDREILEDSGFDYSKTTLKGYQNFKIGDSIYDPNNSLNLSGTVGDKLVLVGSDQF